jgi:hypothetical protein
MLTTRARLLLAVGDLLVPTRSVGTQPGRSAARPAQGQVSAGGGTQSVQEVRSHAERGNEEDKEQTLTPARPC